MEVLTNKNFQLDKNYIDILKKMKEKENEIEFLKSKVNSLISNDSNSNVPFEPIDVTFNKIEEDSLQSSPHTNKHQRFLSDVNTKNVNDLADCTTVPVDIFSETWHKDLSLETIGREVIEQKLRQHYADFNTRLGETGAAGRNFVGIGERGL